MYTLKIEVYNEYCENCPHLEIIREGLTGTFESKCHFPGGCMQKEKVYKEMEKYMKQLKEEIENTIKEDTPWPKN